MWVAFGSVNAAITNESDVNERFIFAASFNRSPAVPVLLCLSDPAKSTRLNLPILKAPGPLFWQSTSKDKMFSNYHYYRKAITDLLLIISMVIVNIV